MVYIPKKKVEKDLIVEERKTIPDIDDITIEQKIKVLQFCKLVSATYMGEVQWNIYLSEYDTNNIMKALLKENLVERVPVIFDGEPRLLLRVYDMSSIGQGGFENFSKKRWFAITPLGMKFLEDNNGL